MARDGESTELVKLLELFDSPVIASSRTALLHILAVNPKPFDLRWSGDCTETQRQNRPAETQRASKTSKRARSSFTRNGVCNVWRVCNATICPDPANHRTNSESGPEQISA